jgi:hypothetical protein
VVDPRSAALHQGDEVLTRKEPHPLNIAPVAKTSCRPRDLRVLVPTSIPYNCRPRSVIRWTGRHGSPYSQAPWEVQPGTMGHGKALSEKSVETTQIYEGTNQIQRVVIAKHLLG